MLDVRNTPVTGANEEDLARFELALKSFQSYVGDPVQLIDEVLDAAPGFTLAHLFRCAALYLTSERRYEAPARKSFAEAATLLPHAGEREQLLGTAFESLLAGNWDNACRQFDDVLKRYPQDVFALQVAHLMDFFRGDALNLRNRPGRVLQVWDPSTPGYGYVLGMYAFGLEEANQYELAEQLGRRALDIDARDVWSVHAVTHVMEMQGRADEGIQFLRSREADWGYDNGFTYHNWWHLALLYLEQRADDTVLAIYDANIFDPTNDLAISLLDATAMLWRLRLFGVDVADRFRVVADMWETKLEAERGFYPFNDFHAALAFAATDRPASLHRVLAGLQEASDADGSSAMMARDVGLPLVQAVVDYHTGHYADAARVFDTVRDIAHRFGGSHAQRDIIALSALAAAVRAADEPLAQHLLNERRMAKPQSILGARVVEAAT